MTLRSVPTVHYSDEEPVPTATLPSFEGKDVKTTKVVIGSTATLDFDNVVLRQDDIVRVTIEARVMGIDHRVNQITGDLERIHRIKPIEATVTAWDVNNPDDTGVFR